MLWQQSLADYPVSWLFPDSKVIFQRTRISNFKISDYFKKVYDGEGKFVSENDWTTDTFRPMASSG